MEISVHQFVAVNALIMNTPATCDLYTVVDINLNSDTYACKRPGGYNSGRVGGGGGVGWGGSRVPTAHTNTGNTVGELVPVVLSV